jgi:outer membrane lipoprotein-sorting protein
MWNYLPKVERTIKIPPSMMLQPWMGSDFTNDDLVKESSIVYDYIHTVIAQENIDGKIVYKINLIPKPDAAVTWGKIIFWIRKDDYVPLREEFYDEHNKLIKVLEYSQIKQMSDRAIPTIWKMVSKVKEGNATTIEVEDALYNQPVDENIFSLSNLKSTE